MYLRVEFLDPYYDSLARLDDSPETNEAVRTLEADLMLNPEGNPPLDGLLRGLKTEPAAGLPPLRLFYYIEHGTVKVIHIEPYDEDEL